MLVTYVKHRQCLIDSDNMTGLYMLGNRAGDAPCSGSQVEHPFATAKRQHLDHLGCQRAADTLHRRTPVEFRGVRRVMKTGLLVVPMAVALRVSVIVGMTVFVPVLVSM